MAATLQWMVSVPRFYCWPSKTLKPGGDELFYEKDKNYYSNTIIIYLMFINYYFIDELCPDQYIVSEIIDFYIFG
jgi:hypothetical protein